MALLRHSEFKTAYTRYIICHSNCVRKYSSSFNDYQYIQKSKTPTLHFQPSLPRLPIPKLEKTCERYLAAQRPLLIEEAYRKTEANVKRFVNSSGKNLQEKLIAKDKRNKHTSYITGPWFDMYLKDRKPLPINYNPVLIHKKDPKSEYNDQLLRSTNLIISSLRFMRSLRENILEPEVYFLNQKTGNSALYQSITRMLPPSLSWYGAYLFKAFPLDMSQYNNLFGSTRKPEIDKDRIVLNTKTKHITVMRKGHFYICDVLDDEGNILPPDIILAKLKFIINDNRSECEYPIGILTTENRDVWATARHMLEALGNERNISLIDSAIFNVILDDVDVDSDNITLVRNYLHSDGKNRWFDKSLSLIITKDGTSGINFEHSWGDGVAVLRYFNDIYKDSTTNPYVHPSTKPNTNVSLDDIKILDVSLDDQMRNVIKRSIRNYQETYSSLDLNYLIFDGIGKKLCKKNSVSPDAVMQLGFQSAFFKQAGKYTSTYESCSTAAFKHGRTETVRPCTIATKAFCDELHLRKPTKGELLSLLKKCSEMHAKLTREAAMGQGFDRHLFGLKHIAEENGLPTPTMFDDLSYAALNHCVLSTSTLSSPHVLAGGFGPVVQDGYGIGYTIADDSLGILVTSYIGQKDSSDFVRCLNESYKEIKDILN